MTTPIIPPAINTEIFQAIYDACIEYVELMPETQKILHKRDELIAQTENKLSREMRGDLSDLYITLACQFGTEMLRLGIAFGHNPAGILTMPD